MLNKPFAPGPNKRPVPLTGPDVAQRVADRNDPAQHYDLKKGRYGVVVSVGKARESRIEEGSEGLGLLFQAEPQLFQMLGDIWLKFQTWPGHQEAAERVKKMLPPPLQQDEGDAAKAQQELGQVKQAAAQMQQQLQQASEIIRTKQVEQQAKIAVEKIAAQKDVALQRMRDATAITVAKINAATKGLVSANEAEVEAIALAHEAEQAELERAHDVGLQAMSGQQALDGADQAHGQELETMALQPSTPPNGNGQA